jgi:phospholipid/cholesterol/gamma-HCH transport system substrate-binding protein
LPADRILTGSRTPELTDIAAGIGVRANELLDSANSLVSSRLGEDLHLTMVALRRAMDALSRVGTGPLVPQTTATLAATEQLLVRLDSTLGGASGGRVDSLTANLNAVSASLARSTESLDSLLAMMRRGEGTLGRLATDSALYVNLTHVLASLDSILVDFKLRPGRYLPTVKVF